LLLNEDRENFLGSYRYVLFSSCSLQFHERVQRDPDPEKAKEQLRDMLLLQKEQKLVSDERLLLDLSFLFSALYCRRLVWSLLT
jgi:hypothetical protein